MSFKTVVALSALLVTQVLAAQTSDPQALALIAQSARALNNGTVLADATVTGTARWTVGGTHDSGTVTLKVKGSSQSRVDLSLSQARRIEVRSQPGTAPQGAWLHPLAPSFSTAPHSFAAHNLYSESQWFFPALTALTGAPASYVASYIGAETHNGVQVQHVRLVRGATAEVQRFSATDYYLDAHTLLPVAMRFITHPDNNAAGASVPIEIRYANYQAVNGVQVPYSIQKYLNDVLILDVTVQSVALNSGVADSEFMLQ